MAPPRRGFLIKTHWLLVSLEFYRQSRCAAPHQTQDHRPSPISIETDVEDIHNILKRSASTAFHSRNSVFATLPPQATPYGVDKWSQSSHPHNRLSNHLLLKFPAKIKAWAKTSVSREVFQSMSVLLIWSLFFHSMSDWLCDVQQVMTTSVNSAVAVPFNIWWFKKKPFQIKKKTFFKFYFDLGSVLSLMILIKCPY